MMRKCISILLLIAQMYSADPNTPDKLGPTFIECIKEKKADKLASSFIGPDPKGDNTDYVNKVIKYFNSEGNACEYVGTIVDGELGAVLIVTTMKEGKTSYDIDPLFAKLVNGKWLYLNAPDRVDAVLNKLSEDEVKRYEILRRNANRKERDKDRPRK